MKSVIITGASGNLGKAIAEKFLIEGYNVAGTVLSKQPTSKQAGETSMEDSVVDLRNEDSADRFVSATIEKYGAIDVAVLTAGGFVMGDIASTGMQDIVQQFTLNFQTAYNIARPVFLQMMKQGSGYIFLVGSTAGADMKKSKGKIAYGLSKSLLFRLAELFNEEAIGKSIRTSVIIPSTIDTPQNRKAMPDADFTKWTKPEKIADLVFEKAVGKSAYEQSFDV